MRKRYVDDSDPQAALAEVMDGSPFPAHLAQRIASTPPHHDDENPLWQGPCGEGELGGITQSMLVRFLSCRERFRLRYVCGLESPDKWNHKMGYGNMWHVCEEAHAAQGVGGPAVVSEWWKVLYDYFEGISSLYPMQRDEIAKWYNVCRVQFPEYVKHWSDHPDVLSRKPLLQEQVFDVPYSLPSGRVVRLRGKWDSVDFIPAHTDEDGRQWPDGIWLQENKTKGDIDQLQVERQLKFDLQTMLYLVALKETTLGQYGVHPIMGVRYNVVRRPLSGGKGNISPHKAKGTGTKYVPAETSEHFYNRLRDDYIALEPHYWFFRVKCGISSSDIDRFKRTCLDPLLETLCVWYEVVTDTLRISPQDIMKMMNYRTPFGVWSALEEGGATEYDECLATGSEVGLRRVHELFTELK